MASEKSAKLGKLLTMSEKERERSAMCRGLSKKEVSLKEAAEELGLCERQMRRVYRRWQASGDARLVSHRRGRKSDRARDEVRLEFIDWYKKLSEKGKYHPRHATQMFVGAGGEQIAGETGRRWLIGAGLWKKKSRRASVVYEPRARRSSRGELV